MYRFGPPRGGETLPRYLLKYRSQFIISSIGGIVYNTAIVLGPILMGRLLDQAAGGTGTKVLLSALFFVGVTVFFQLARVVKRWFMRDQFNRVACDLRQTFLERTLGRPLPDLEKEKVGDLMSRTVGDITLVVDTVMTTLNEGWDTWLLMLSYFVALMARDWKITLAASVMVPLTLVLAQSLRHVLYRYAMAARRAAGAATTGLQHVVDATAMLRLFGREEAEADTIADAFGQQAKFNIRETLLQQAFLPIYALIAGLGIVAAIALGGQNVIRGEWTVGTFNAYLVMFIAFSGRTRVAARVFNRWHAARAAWSRVKEKMARTPGTSGPAADTTAHEAPAHAEPHTDDLPLLTVEGLGFSYGGEDVLHGLTFSAARGQIIGITGAVGSGKTALALALTGQYPYTGSILLEGCELSSLSTDARRRRIAYAGHEQYLFSLSIRENLQLGGTPEMPEPAGGDEGAPEDRVRMERVLAASALDQDLARFAGGLDTPVGEKGVRVSGGQRQRIALARALYNDAPLLLLDDPFSAVDIATEKRILDHLSADYHDRVILLFTHRLTAFRRADHILVLDHGHVAQQGTHDSLAAQPGLYREIYEAQRFLEEDGHAQDDT